MQQLMDVKQHVREFYNQVGWQEVSEGVYQNARYEDLRPVAREYIERCHQRVARQIKPEGQYLLDAGSGPIQYPAYLEYSQGYRYRVCADLSSVALQEARKRIGGSGLFVVADIANLPFAQGVFEGVVSLHTIHHLPADEHGRAYLELYRVLAPASTAVVVNGWDCPPLAALADGLIGLVRRLKGGKLQVESSAQNLQPATYNSKPNGTYVRKHNAAWLKREVSSQLPPGSRVEIGVWRSVNVHFLRTFVHDKLAGRLWLRLLFWLEERFPRFCGENGQYPLIAIRKA
jgi:SAM-dependent methyltransferase